MPVNKVVYNGDTLVDLTEDTVTEDTLLVGIKAHDRSGNVIEGNLQKDIVRVDALPIGTIIPYVGDADPEGWLSCGTLGNRTEHSELFAIIGEKYGAGDGETTFALPPNNPPLAYTRDGAEVQLIDQEPKPHMIIKAKQIIPITGGVVNDRTSKSETDALSAMATHSLLEKHATDLPEIIFGTTKMVKDETYALNKSINRFRYILIMYAPLPSLHCMNTMLVPVRFIDMNASTASNQFNMHCRISEESFAYSQIGFVNETTLKAQTASGTGKYPDVYVKICGIR